MLRPRRGPFKLLVAVLLVHKPPESDRSSGGLVVCALCGTACVLQACKALHAACRKAVEQRVNEALDDSFNTGEAEASRCLFCAGFTGLAKQICPTPRTALI